MKFDRTLRKRIAAGESVSGVLLRIPNEELVEVAACSGVDFILLDWNMPNVDGYAFLQALRQRPGGTGPKILFCTTENDVGAIARALRAGADEYIMKPFDRDILTAKLEQVGVVQADAA